VSAVLTQLAGAGVAVAANLIQITPKSSIGGIAIQAILEETHVDRLEVTEHPVESGTPISDHSFARPTEVMLRCGWSNASTEALTGAVTALFSGGGLSASDYVLSVYSQLLALQKSRQPFSIKTTKRSYDNMMMPSLYVTTDEKTSQALLVTATCREVIIATTQSTTLPAQSKQTDPSSTAETQNLGSATVVPGTPAPGGSVSPSNWTPTQP
jgi:hypothetical protein